MAGISAAGPVAAAPQTYSADPPWPSKAASRYALTIFALTLMVNILNETRRAALLQAVTADPAVAAVAASSPRTPAVAETPVAAETTTDRSAGSSTRLPIDEIAVSPEYFDVLDIDVVRGRGFTRTERTAEAGVAIVTDTVARRLWPTRDAVGQVGLLDVVLIVVVSVLVVFAVAHVAHHAGDGVARALSSRPRTVTSSRLTLRKVAGSKSMRSS